MEIKWLNVRRPEAFAGFDEEEDDEVVDVGMDAAVVFLGEPGGGVERRWLKVVKAIVQVEKSAV